VSKLGKTQRSENMAYVHGYSERETQRLYEQAEILEDILHTGTAFPAGAGCWRPGVAWVPRPASW
jgi:hypothetical protein